MLYILKILNIVDYIMYIYGQNKMLNAMMMWMDMVAPSLLRTHLDFQEDTIERTINVAPFRYHIQVSKQQFNTWHMKNFLKSYPYIYIKFLFDTLKILNIIYYIIYICSQNKMLNAMTMWMDMVAPSLLRTHLSSQRRHL